MIGVFIKKVVWVFCLPALLFAVVIASYNLTIDPYGVLNKDMAKQKTEPNQHYLKRTYLASQPTQFNAFLLGNSRTEKIDVSKIKDGNRWYNLGYSEALPSEHLADIEFLLEQGVQINKILLGVDEISYLISPTLHQQQSLRKIHTTDIATYLYYLFLKPSQQMYQQIQTATLSPFFEEGAYTRIYKDGVFRANKKDRYIEQNTAAHITDEVFEQAYWPKHNHNRVDKTIAEIKELLLLCEQEDIDVVVFINPMYQKTYQKAVENDWFLFLEKLGGLTDYYDFSQIDNITDSPYYFYENSHYRPLVGDRIVYAIFD